MTTDSRTKSIDMLQGPLTGRLILFALPIAFSSMLQQLFNAADTAVVGRFADADALAAVGTNGEIVALLVTLSAGLAVGANVLIAQYIGEGKQTQISRALHTSLVCALLFGLLGAVLGQWISAPLLRMIRTPEAVLTDAVLYLRIYFCGLPFLMLYDFGAAIFRSKGNSRLPLSHSGPLRDRQCRPESAFCPGLRPGGSRCRCGHGSCRGIVRRPGSVLSS